MFSTLPGAPRRLAATALCAAGLVLSAGCGSDDDPSPSSSSGASAASLVPAAAPFYGEVAVRPDGDQAEAIKALTQKIAPGEDLGKRITTLLEKGGSKRSYARDIEPWLGEKAGGVVTALPQGGSEAPDYALLIDTTDVEKAKAALRGFSDGKSQEKSHAGTSYLFDAEEKTAGAVIGKQLVVGSEAGLKAIVDAAKGPKLADVEEFKTMREQVEPGVAFFYGDFRRLLDLAKGADLSRAGVTQAQLDGYRELLEKQGIRQVALSLVAKADSIRLDSAYTSRAKDGEDDGAEVVAGLPAGAWLAFGFGDLGKGVMDAFGQLKAFGSGGSASGAGPLPDFDAAIKSFEQQIGLDLEDDLLSWMGRGGLFVRGASITEIGGALVVESKDEARTRATLTKLRELATKSGFMASDIRTEGIDAGFQLQIPGAPIAVFVALGKGKFVLAANESSLKEALDPAETLSDDAAFKASADQLGGAKPTFFLDFRTVVQFLDLTVGSDPGYAKAKKYLDAFTTITAGSKRDGPIRKSTLAIGVR